MAPNYNLKMFYSIIGIHGEVKISQDFASVASETKHSIVDMNAKYINLFTKFFGLSKMNNAFFINIEIKFANYWQNYNFRRLLKPAGVQVFCFLRLKRI